MSRVELCVVDILSMCRKLDRAGPFSPMVYETWLTKLYVKAHSVPCVSDTLLDSAPESGFAEDRLKLTQQASRLGIDPLKELPYPGEFSSTVRGLTFFVNDGLLYMGDYRAIERIRGCLHPRCRRHRILDIARIA